jgi:hypothetical protein
MFRKTYLILCAACLFVKIMGVLTLGFGKMYSCDYPSLCHDLESYLVMTIIFFYIDPLLLLVTSTWLIRAVTRVEKYPKENIFMALSWLIAISNFSYLGFIGYSG